MKAKLRALMAILALCCVALSASAQRPSPESQAARRLQACQRAGDSAGVIAAWQTLAPTMRAGTHAPLVPFVALAYDTQGDASQAHAMLEGLGNVLRGRSNYLTRSPASRAATFAALERVAPLLTSDVARADCAALLALPH